VPLLVEVHPVRAVFDQHGVCWAPYRSVRELVADRERGLSSNPLFAPIDQPGVGTLTTAGHPLHLAGSTDCAPLPAPRLGQHTAEVLGGILKLSTRQLGELQARGVIALA
jgi:2-methylfumaryl-CoA isomerase